MEEKGVEAYGECSMGNMEEVQWSDVSYTDAGEDKREEQCYGVQIRDVGSNERSRNSIINNNFKKCTLSCSTIHCTGTMAHV